MNPLRQHGSDSMSRGIECAKCNRRILSRVPSFEIGWCFDIDFGGLQLFLSSKMTSIASSLVFLPRHPDRLYRILLDGPVCIASEEKYRVQQRERLPESD